MEPFLIHAASKMKETSKVIPFLFQYEIASVFAACEAVQSQFNQTDYHTFKTLQVRKPLITTSCHLP